VINGLAQQPLANGFRVDGSRRIAVWLPLRLLQGQSASAAKAGQDGGL